MAKAAGRKRSKSRTRPKVLCSLFCSFHSTDTSGRQNYLGVFDGFIVRLKGRKPPKKLPDTVITNPFVVTFRVNAPNSSTWHIRVTNPGKKEIVRSSTRQLAESDSGMHSIQLHFGNGIRVHEFGGYSFDLYLDDKKIGTATLPVTCRMRK